MRTGIATGLLCAMLMLAAGCETSGIPAASPQPRNGSEDPQTTVRSLRDPARARVWSLTVDGVLVNNAQASVNTIVTLPGWTWADAPWSCTPDMAIGPGGEAVVTSNVLPIVWRIDPDTLAVSEHPLTLDADGDKDLGFTGLTYSHEHEAYFAVSGPHGTLWKIDSGLTHGRKVALSMPMHGACRVAISPHMVSQASGQMAVRLCATGEERNWTVDVALVRPGRLRAQDEMHRLAVKAPQLAMTCGD